MNRLLLYIFFVLTLVLAVFNLIAVNLTNAQDVNSEIFGYLIIPNARVPETYDAGFSMYVAAWPLLQKYPGNAFQSGLPGTWLFAKKPDPKPQDDIYSDIEGGLGWWRDTRFATETPKFITGGVSLNFETWCNGPGAGKGRDWKEPRGKYGMAQMAPNVLWPPDGLNLKQGTCGEFLGYGYLPLPLTEPKTTTNGKKVPTGNQCWTLFLNAGNFKGPVGFFTPYFFSEATTRNPHLAGIFLDSTPSDPNRAIQMETQHIPCNIAKSADGITYARATVVQFPCNEKGESVVLHDCAVYNRAALWDSVKDWFDGGKPATGSIDAKESTLYEFRDGGYSTWEVRPEGSEKSDRFPIDWASFAKPKAFDKHTYGYHWEADKVHQVETKNGKLINIPEYFKLEEGEGGKKKWSVVTAKDVPEDTGLTTMKYEQRDGSNSGPYITPEEADSCWKKPGPIAGPFKAELGDGSVVTYYWYRFADQPSLLNADLTDDEREQLQKRVEMIHRTWTKDREYLPPPTSGKLADIDPALIVTPPDGLKIGYVPIVTRQEWGGN